MIELKLFAAARQITGHDSLSIELPLGATVGDLRNALASSYPDLEPIVRSSMFAIDEQYVGDDNEIVENSRVACIPPVSGG